MCERQGRVAGATLVDHIKPHKGDQVLFWEQANWQPLCATCHSKHKQREELGLIQRLDADGWPL